MPVLTPPTSKGRTSTGRCSGCASEIAGMQAPRAMQNKGDERFFMTDLS
jgi:hypothetical protein